MKFNEKPKKINENQWKINENQWKSMKINKINRFSSPAKENPWLLLPGLKKTHQKSIKILPGRLLAGFRSLQSSSAGLQISEISKIHEKCWIPKKLFSQLPEPKKMFWVRCVVSKSLIPQHVEFWAFLKPSPPNALFQFRDSGQPPDCSIEAESTQIDENEWK